MFGRKISFKDYDYGVVGYLRRLALFSTQADPKGLPTPTLKRFEKCADCIASELKKSGIKDVEVTKEAYVYATIPSNLDHETPVIALMAHYDTALENPGKGTKMLVHTNYQGGDITLPLGNTVIPERELKDKKGHDILTGSGDNQLGADDKTGVAVLMDVARFLQNNNDIKHGTIKLVFNNNEEVGRGTEHLDYKKLGADYAYCVDSGEIGKLFQENFNADAVTVYFEGVTEHPGYAYKKMVNALFVAHDFVSILRKKFKGPEDSHKREPYLGLNSITGTWTKASVHYLLRGFDESDIEKMKVEIARAKKEISKKYKQAVITEEWDAHHIYKNSADILKKHSKVNKIAAKAYKAVGVKVQKDLTRGGFDGVRMSFEGLPTTNVFSAAYNMHGLNEWTTRQELETTVQMVVHICNLWGKEKR